jgi:hypothetical protein
MPTGEYARARALTVAEEAIREGHYREILALIKGFDGQFKAFDDRLKETRDDAREARDAAKVLTERFNAQDLPTKLAELAGYVEKGLGDGRSDLVNVSDKLTREMREGHEAHDKRIIALEAFRLKIEGATGIIGWLAKNAPWLLALSMTAVAAIGFKDKLP